MNRKRLKLLFSALAVSLGYTATVRGGNPAVQVQVITNDDGYCEIVERVDSLGRRSIARQCTVIREGGRAAFENQKALDIWEYERRYGSGPGEIEKALVLHKYGLGYNGGMAPGEMQKSPDFLKMGILYRGVTNAPEPKLKPTSKAWKIKKESVWHHPKWVLWMWFHDSDE